MLLLHLMFFMPRKNLGQYYVDHQLQSISHEWGTFVQQSMSAIKYSLHHSARPCCQWQSGTASPRFTLSGLSAASCKPNEILVLARHQQDQAETLMLRLLSGAGIDGLAAMKADRYT